VSGGPARLAGCERLSVVVPVYESGVVDELVDRLEAVLAVAAPDHEIVLVDDASPGPAIWPQLERLASERAAVRAVRLTRNFGQQAATLCGLAEATGDFVATMDDDLQQRPEDLPALLARRDHDIVVAQFPRRHHRWSQRLTSRVKGLFDRLLVGTPRGLRLTSFRLLRRTVVDGMLAVRTPHPFIPALMFHVSGDVVGVAVDHEPRREGRSGYSFLRRLGVFSNLLINNSSLPLRLVGQAGALLALASFALTAIVVYRRLVHDITVSGWTSLLAATLLLGGLNLFSLSIVGEYLLRIIATGEAKPTYFVRSRAGVAPSPVAAARAPGAD